MDANLTIVYALIGAIISQACEQATFFKDPNQPDLKKFLVVFGLCIVAALVFSLVALNTLPSTYAAWRTFLESVIVMAASSQAFNLATTKWGGDIGTFLNSLRTTMTVSTSTSTGTSVASSATYSAVTKPVYDTRTTPLLGTPIPVTEIVGEEGSVG